MGSLRITTVICAIAVVLAIIFFVYTFMVEGFQNRLTLEEANKRMGPNSDDVCKAFGDGTKGDCYKCLDPDGVNHAGIDCGYWAQGNACIPRSGVYRLVPEWLTAKQNTDNTYPQTFDPHDFVYNVGKCGGATCANFKTCRTCAGAAACGWCDTNNTCMDRTAVSANVGAIMSEGSKGSNGSSPQPMCPAAGSSGQTGLNSATMVTASSDLSHLVLVEDIGTCRPEVCADKKSCSDCTNTSGCGFCRTTGTCIPVDSGGQHDALSQTGSTGSSGSNICPTGQISLQSYMCPCSGMSDCGTCASTPGCGWCLGDNSCVNVESNGAVNQKDCTAGPDGVATSTAQCTPGAMGSGKGKLLGNMRSDKTSNYKPGAAELDLVQDNAALSDTGRELNLEGSIGTGVIGAGPVSAAKTTKEVTGNGVVRPVGATGGGPYTLTNQPGLFTSPFEEYVKVLIKSELAESGVPLNEPFQNQQVAVTSANSSVANYVTKSITKMIR